MSSWVLSCTVVAPAHRPTPSHITPRVARQKASAFNQPLSFDTSSVTGMLDLFSVRACPVLPICSGALSCTLRAPRSPAVSHLPARSSPRMSPPMSVLVTRQQASAFNQPLSLDTSSVTSMAYMFYVRAVLALPPPCPVVPPCTLLAPLLHRQCPTPCRLLTPHIAPLVTRQRALAFNQPLSFDTSSVTDMYQMFYVRSAHALPPNSPVGFSLHALLTTTHTPPRTCPNVVP